MNPRTRTEAQTGPRKGAFTKEAKMYLFKRIGKEMPGTVPELEVVEFPTADTPDSILFQGNWKTENGEFFLEFEGLKESEKILWLRIIDWNEGGEVIAELTDLTEFANQYPNCMEELISFCRETRI